MILICQKRIWIPAILFVFAWFGFIQPQAFSDNSDSSGTASDTSNNPYSSSDTSPYVSGTNPASASSPGRHRHRNSQGNQQTQQSKNNTPQSDDEIKTNILHALSTDPSLEGSNIDVQVTSGIATLKGTTLAQTQKAVALSTAKLVPGVQKIVSQIEVEKEAGAGKSGNDGVLQSG